MLRPDHKEFERLAHSATLVPIIKTVTADLQTPVSAFLSLAEGERHAFLLESVEGAEKVGMAAVGQVRLSHLPVAL